MIPYYVTALFSIIIFALVHLWAAKTRQLNVLSHGRFLSAGGGVAIAYVFVDLLPNLSENDQIVKKAFAEFFPLFERHAYLMALAGFLLFFIVDRTHSILRRKEHLWLSFGSYALFNFLVGYAVVDKDNPDIQPLALFTFAMALHYFTNDYSLSKDHGKMYEHAGKWLLIASLFLGWLVGIFYVLPETSIALISAFIGGGVIMNVTRHELPKETPHSLGAFLIAALFYTIILLAIGR